jgi:hypothetical protein
LVKVPIIRFVDFNLSNVDQFLGQQVNWYVDVKTFPNGFEDIIPKT